MRRGLILMGVPVALAAVWALGLFAPLAAGLRALQHEAQSALAGAIRALAQGQDGAWAGLLGLCFAYGFLHAAGPGHGKVLIGGYGLARQIGFARLAGVALVSALGQALVAIALVAVLALVAAQLARGLAEDWAATLLRPLSLALVSALGIWLILRGLRRIGGLWRARRGGGLPAGPPRRGPAGAAGAAPARAGDLRRSMGRGLAAQHLAQEGPAARAGRVLAAGAAGVGGAGSGAVVPGGSGVPAGAQRLAPCPECGGDHGADPRAIAAAHSGRDLALLVAGIALRPCSGALFLLIITWQFDLLLAGVLGTLAMGLGTGMVQVLIAGLAVWTRAGAFAGLGALAGAPARFLPVVEIAAGVAILVAGFTLFTLPG